MNDEQLSRLIHRAAQQREPLDDPRWERLADGTASEEDRAALAQMERDGEVPEGTLAAFAPMGEPRKDAIAEAVAAEISAGAAPEASSGLDKIVDLNAARARKRRWAFAGSLLAAAAAAVLVFRPPEPTMPPVSTNYLLELSGGDRALRSEDEVGVFATGARFVLVVRPETTLQQSPPRARAYVERDGQKTPWPRPLQAAPTGAFRLSGTIGQEIDDRPGEAVLIVELTDATGGPPRVLRHPIRIVLP